MRTVCGSLCVYIQLIGWLLDMTPQILNATDSHQDVKVIQQEQVFLLFLENRVCYSNGLCYNWMLIISKLIHNEPHID